MAIGENGEVLGRVHTLFAVGAVGDLSDGQLLERFATGRGEAAELAFAALVERHGAMVLRVCRGVLAESHDAEDAFQATFLVLVRRARSLWVRDSLGPWLHQVAYRTASCLRSTAARRRRIERGLAAGPAEDQRGSGDDLARVLHEELGRLPEQYRAPVVLCDLESSTHEQAARHLGWPVGTVKSRLTRAREILRDRLRRRGVAPDAGLLLAALRSRGSEVWIPPALAASTSRAVFHSVTSRSALHGPAAALAREVLRAMSIHRAWKVAALVATVAASASGLRALAQREAAPAARADDLPSLAVKRGKFRVGLTERGVVEASRVASVVSEVEGTTTILFILPEGSKVKKGEKVAQLDSATLRNILANQQVTTKQAEASYEGARLTREVAELALREYVEGVYAGEQASLKGAIASARTSLESAEGRRERTRKARERLTRASAERKVAEAPADIVAELDIEDRIEAAERGIADAKRALEAAESKLALLETHTAPRTRRELALAIDRAREAELVRKGAWEVEKAKGARLERQIARSTLVAPGDGVVVYANDPGRLGGINRVQQIEEGATVRERQVIFRVVDPKGPMILNAKARESMVDRIRPGQRARIKIDAFPGVEVAGSVATVAPMPDPNTFFADQKKVYTTRVRVEDGPAGLRPGLSGEVDITLDERDDVITVPVGAVLRFEDKDHVAVKTPRGFELREVTLGISDETSVEVRRGLEDGEVVLRDPAAVVDEARRRMKLGVPVRPAAPPSGPGSAGPAPRGK